jgi:Tfp pilus assembly ATPase PilU
MLKRGLVLMVGATGSGKSTSLAAMINYRTRTRRTTCSTVEDPIEFLHSNKKSIINQREVGLDTKSFHRALRSAMRAAPDVILIGEIRDRESMEYAITFAGTGPSLPRDAACEQRRRDDGSHHQHVPPRSALADLSGSVAVPEGNPVAAPGDGQGRPAATRRSEVLLNTPHVQELIKKGDVVGVKEALVRSNEKGMQSFDVSLYQLYLTARSRSRMPRQRRLAHQSRSQDQLRLTRNFSQHGRLSAHARLAEGRAERRASSYRSCPALQTRVGHYVRPLLGEDSVCIEHRPVDADALHRELAVDQDRHRTAGASPDRACHEFLE